jgi:hypothetical protein
MFVFDSVADMTRNTNPNLFEKGAESFVGMALKEWEAVEERSKTAWAGGLLVLEAFIERLAKVEIPDLKSHKRETKFSQDEGDELDMDKLYQGEAFWRKTEREQSTGSDELTIIIDTSTPCSVDSDDILWRGAAAIALTQILEDKGYKVEVIMVNGTYLYQGKNFPVVTACRLKAPGDPLDTSSLINAVAGWFYRTACFTLMRTFAKLDGEQLAWGLGTVYTCRAADLDVLTPDESRIFASSVFTFNGAANLMVAELERLAGNPDKQPKDK